VISAGGDAGAPLRGDRGVSYDSPLNFKTPVFHRSLCQRQHGHAFSPNRTAFRLFHKPAGIPVLKPSKLEPAKTSRPVSLNQIFYGQSPAF
jgi:hypothetical protein